MKFYQSALPHEQLGFGIGPYLEIDVYLTKLQRFVSEMVIIFTEITPAVRVTCFIHTHQFFNF